MLKAKKAPTLEQIGREIKSQRKKAEMIRDLNIELRGNRKAAEVAIHYGFRPIETPVISKEDLSKTRTLLDLSPLKPDELSAGECIMRAEEKVSLMRHFDKKDMGSWPQPIMLYYEGPMMTEGTRRKLTDPTYCHLDILGTTKSIAEATLLKTAYEILKEDATEEVEITVNTIGDKESIQRFTKELTLYYRKHLEELHAPCRQIFKKDAYEMLHCTHEKCVELRKAIPDPVGYLTEPSRRHFAEVLEYLEALRIPYEIRKDLIENKKFHNHTIFEIRTKETKKLLARGVRYNEIVKKLGMKRDAGAIGITISLSKNESRKSYLKKIVSPKVYFIQLGFNAKLKSLEVMDVLRRERIPITQSLARDKMLGQLQIAENLRIPYTIIMGQKEAMENSVIVRDMSTHSQDTVRIPDLARYLRRIA